MTVYFFDSSALVKRYVTETGTTWVRSVMPRSTGNIIFISHIAPVEVVSALARRKREGNISPRTFKAAGLFLNRHAIREYELVYLSDPITRRAQELLGIHTLRASDAIQLASALYIQAQIASAHRLSLVFVCSDTRLLNAAAAEGMQVHHPV